MRRCCFYFSFFSGIFALLGGLAFGGEVVETFSFPADFLEIREGDYGVGVSFKDGELIGEPGLPALPRLGRNITLPAGTVPVRVRVVNVTFETLPGSFRVAPVQPPAILYLRSVPDLVEPDRLVYQQERFYPESLCVIAGQGEWGERSVVALLVAPVQYLPAKGLLRRVKEMRVAVEYEPGSGYMPRRFRDGEGLSYLVVTGRGLDTVFTDLCRWRWLTGLNAEIRDIDWILARYPGRDGAERLRNYLKICARDSGLKYLLLGGDVEIVPVRKAFAFASNAGIHLREDSLPCDLYYADLNGNWDENQNQIFGEVADQVDLYPDIYVGRAPVKNATEARAFVNKLITYEQAGNRDYQHRAVFSAAVLWDEPYTDEAVAKERIRLRYLPGHFDVRTLYESQTRITVDTALVLLDAGFGIFNHCGHGWIDALALAHNAVLRSRDVDRLTNLNASGIGYSIGCWTAAFDFDAIGERFVLNPDGGGVAFIGHSSYGWGAPGNPGFGYSDRFDERFFYELFRSPGDRLGEIFARTKSYFIPFSQEANVYRWHQFCLNLLGDPAMRVYTDTPGSLLVYKPGSVGTGAEFTRITVLDRSGPVVDATVSLCRNTAVYSGKTGRDGTAVIQHPPFAPGRVDLFVTAGNYHPVFESLTVIRGPVIGLTGLTVLDSAGDKNGYPSAGEEFFLRLEFQNTGDAPSARLRWHVTVNSPYFVVDSSPGELPGLNPGERISVRSPRYRVAPDAPNGAVGLFKVTITDQFQMAGQFPFALQVAMPEIKVAGYLLEPRGETTGLWIKVVNSGFAPAINPAGTIFKPDPVQPVQLVTPGLIFPSIPAGDTVWSLTPVRLITRLSDLRIGVNIVAGGYRFSDTLYLSLLPAGLSASFDDGYEGWSFTGTGINWTLSSRRSFSLPYSLYTGDGGGNYPDNCTCHAVSPWFLLPNSACLSFYRWYSVPVYGADGLYVILQTENGEDTLDFIGAGGALGQDQGLLVSDWLRHFYDLSDYPAGDSARLVFVFVADGDRSSGEGFYLDDIGVRSAESLFGPVPDQNEIVNLFPNPFRGSTTIMFSTSGEAEPVRLAIFDLTGRRLRTLFEGMINPGYHSVFWDGTDERYRRLPAGIYFLKLDKGNLLTTRRCFKIVKLVE